VSDIFRTLRDQLKHGPTVRLVVVIVIFLIVFVFGVFFTTSAAFRDPGGTASIEPITVEFSFGAEDIEVYHGMETLLNRAIDESGRDIRVTYRYAYTDVELEAENIQTAIENRPDVLVVMPQDSIKIQESIRAARRAGIPVVAYNRAPEPMSGAEPTAFIGLDTVDQAYTTALVLFTRMTEDGVPLRVINVMGSLVDRNAINRNIGLIRAAAESGAVIVDSVETDWMPDKAYRLFSESIENHPDARAVFVASDWLLSGVQRALEETGRWYPYGDERHFYLGSQDVFTTGAQLIRSGYVDVATAFDLWPMSAMLVQVILAVARDRELHQTVLLVPGRVITAENIDSQPDLWHTHLDYE
jgi:ribose transport system substrate-binding protein